MKRQAHEVSEDGHPRRDLSPVRVAVITPFGSGGVYSGPTIFIDRIVRASGSDVRFILIYAQRSHADQGFSSAPSERLTRVRNRALVDQVVWSSRAVWWAFRRAGDYDVLHLHGTQTYNLLAAWGAQLRGIPVLLLPLGEHELSERSLTNRIWPASSVRRRLIGRAAGALAITRGIAANLERSGLAAAAVVEFGNPVDERFFRFGSGVDRFDQRRVVFLGVLSDRKRPHLILEAIALLRDAGTDLTLHLYGPFGTPEYRALFENSVTQLGLADRVHHEDYLEDTAGMLTSDASVLVLPSREEGLPGAVVEAMAAGVPTVVTDVGAMGDTVRAARCGYVVPGAARDIADALEALTDDRSAWAKMSARARDFAAAHFSAERLAETYSDTVRTLTSTARRKASTNGQ